MYLKNVEFNKYVLTDTLKDEANDELRLLTRHFEPFFNSALQIISVYKFKLMEDNLIGLFRIFSFYKSFAIQNNDSNQIPTWVIEGLVLHNWKSFV